MVGILLAASVRAGHRASVFSLTRQSLNFRPESAEHLPNGRKPTEKIVHGARGKCSHFRAVSAFSAVSSEASSEASSAAVKPVVQEAVQTHLHTFTSFWEPISVVPKTRFGDTF